MAEERRVSRASRIISNCPGFSSLPSMPSKRCNPLFPALFSEHRLEQYTPTPFPPFSRVFKKKNSSLTKKKVWKSSVVYVLHKLCLGIESIEELRQCTNIRPVLDRFGIRRVLPDEQRSVHSLPVSFFDPTLHRLYLSTLHSHISQLPFM